METHNATPTSATEEVKAMAKISRILDSVDQATADRIASWLYDRYIIPAPVSPAVGG